MHISHGLPSPYAFSTSSYKLQLNRSKPIVSCQRGGGDLLRQLHDLAVAEEKLSIHQKRLFEIDAKVAPFNLLLHYPGFIKDTWDSKIFSSPIQ